VEYRRRAAAAISIAELLEAVALDRVVLIVEGEAKVDLLRSWNIAATCCACGAKKWRAEHAEYLRGAHVVILPDNDDVGREHMDMVATSLQGIAASTRVLELPDLPPKGDIIDWAANGGTVERLHDLIENAEHWRPPINETDDWKYYSGEPAAPPQWLIKGILPQKGVALIAGQWGTYKTSTALDIAVSIMADIPFAGRYRIKRRGAVLFIALEGESMLSARLKAIADDRGVAGALPFAWRGYCPALTDSDAADTFCALVNKAAFNLPVVMIVVDTLITAAQYQADGADNDAAITQKVMRTLRLLSERTNTMVVGIDHFGKVVETGTRGSSAKEGAADTVIALLADREISGSVKNTRLAVRKQRDGGGGFELPFTAKTVIIGADEDGDPLTATTIDWQASAQPAATAKKDTRWSSSMQLLRRVLMTMLADHGQDVLPFIDGPTVRACNLDLVRNEFYRQYVVAEGTHAQKQDTRRHAFQRAIKGAVDRDVIASREVDGVQLVWLVKLETP
jgi:hypothetical protein